MGILLDFDSHNTEGNCEPSLLLCRWRSLLVRELAALAAFNGGVVYRRTQLGVAGAWLSSRM